MRVFFIYARINADMHSCARYLWNRPPRTAVLLIAFPDEYKESRKPEQLHITQSSLLKEWESKIDVFPSARISVFKDSASWLYGVIGTPPKKMDCEIDG